MIKYQFFWQNCGDQIFPVHKKMRETVNKDDKISAYGVMKYLKKDFI